jgi:PAS domain S-box-containing protein
METNEILPAWFENSTVGFFIINREARILEVNPAGAGMLGMAPKECNGLDIKQFVTLDSLAGFAEFLQQVFVNGTPGVCEIGLLREGVSTASLHIEGVISGQDTCLLNAFDISRMKQSDALLRERENALTQILDDAPLFIALADRDLNYLYVNREYVDFFNRPKSEIIGKNVSEIIGEEAFKRAYPNMIKVLEGQSRSFDNKVINAAGEERIIETRYRPYYQDGSVEGIITIVIDVTERRKAEHSLMENDARLRELNITKDKFLSILAHDLKSPFNSILGFSEMLKNEAKDLDIDTIKLYGGIIHSSAQHTFQLLENLLEWARSQQGLISFNPKAVFLNQLVLDELEGMKGHAGHKSIELESVIEGNVILTADENMLRTCLRNLIANAVKFTPRNGKVWVDARMGKGHVDISVSDNGIGMSRDTQERLFRIETSFSTRGTENEKGTGLGLILCQEFVHKHGGTIRVESSVGKGSTFILTIPA